MKMKIYTSSAHSIKNDLDIIKKYKDLIGTIISTKITLRFCFYDNTTYQSVLVACMNTFDK
jgi:hypothetical protein